MVGPSSASLGLYRRLVAMEVRAQLQYRASFLLDLVTAALILAIEFGTVVMVFARFETLGGWTLPEVALLYGMAAMGFRTMDLIFSGFDPSDFGERVRLGQFDQILLRPAGVALQVLGSRFHLRRLGGAFQGALIFALAVGIGDIAWTPAKVALVPLVLLGQIAFFGALFVAGATVTFWTIQSIEAVNILTYGGNELINYPMHIYGILLRRFFTFVVPAVFVNYAPALYILERADPLGLPPWSRFAAPVVGAGMLALAAAFWRVGLRRYQSTGT